MSTFVATRYIRYLGDWLPNVYKTFATEQVITSKTFVPVIGFVHSKPTRRGNDLSETMHLMIVHVAIETWKIVSVDDRFVGFFEQATPMFPLVVQLLPIDVLWPVAIACCSILRPRWPR